MRDARWRERSFIDMHGCVRGLSPSSDTWRHNIYPKRPASIHRRIAQIQIEIHRNLPAQEFCCFYDIAQRSTCADTRRNIKDQLAQTQYRTFDKCVVFRTHEAEYYEPLPFIQVPSHSLHTHQTTQNSVPVPNSPTSPSHPSTTVVQLPQQRIESSITRLGSSVTRFPVLS